MTTPKKPTSRLLAGAGAVLRGILFDSVPTPVFMWVLVCVGWVWVLTK